MNQRRLPRGSRLFCMAACRRRAWPAVTGLSQPPFTVARFVTQGMVSMRMDTLDWRHKAIATACLALCGAAWSAPFTPGNLVAYRVGTGTGALPVDRKSTRLNSSHLVISYAVFCLK